MEFDPQDAVSVPTDCSFQKLRVSKYKVVADLTDCKRELNKAVYEYNKPIYNSDDEDCCDDEDCDFECDDDSSEVEDDSHEWGDREQLLLSIRNYLENKHSKGVLPSVKNIAGLTMMREAGLRCADVPELVEELGYEIERDDEKVKSERCILPLEDEELEEESENAPTTPF